MRTRIIGLAVWASVLAIGLFGVPLAVAVLRDAGQEQRRELGRLAYAVAIEAAADVEDDRRVGQGLIDEEIEDFDGHGSVQVTVHDEAGDWLGGVRPDGDSPLLDEALEGGVGAGEEDDHFVVAVPVTHSNDVVGAVRAAVPSRAVLQDVLPVWGAMAALAALAVAVAWRVGRVQARQLALPLEDLAVAARRLGEGDFSVRTKPGGVPEIDAVCVALNSAATRLDCLLAREQSFSADASHQLRTPLAGLRLRLEAALEQPEEDLRSAVGASLNDADRLEATIDELWALARKKQAAQAGSIDLVAVLNESASEWRERLARHGRGLEMTIEPGVPVPWASTAAVRQVLAVLVDNATTHGAGTVTVTVREASGAAAIDVSDEGPGQPENVLFQGRADQRNRQGIGLAMARRLAEAELGRLELTRPSPPTLTLLLPTSDETAERQTVAGVSDAS